ncbi:MAG: ABC transporter substrate-binding protein, partial [Planctomycetaceae bacterium]|nr:ABC transporter substrate-binding protein [Planctomycetaceae bacterium]
PMVVTREPKTIDQLRGMTIAVPGTLTTAFLALNLCLGGKLPHPRAAVEPHASGSAGAFNYVVCPFDEILNVVERGEADAGLIIHEGQLTYASQGLHLVVDLGEWWMQETGLPLPLGGNAIRRDLGPAAMQEVTSLLKQSIEYGLAHRDDALRHALQYGRDLDQQQADKFVGMYVNDWTIDFGPRGREAVATLLQRGYEAGLIPEPVKLEFIEG